LLESPGLGSGGGVVAMEQTAGEPRTCWCSLEEKAVVVEIVGTVRAEWGA
jgi:hypothetical protein